MIAFKRAVGIFRTAWGGVVVADFFVGTTRIANWGRLMLLGPHHLGEEAKVEQ